MQEVTHNDPLTEGIIAAAIEVHRTLGPGLLESAYEECLAIELQSRGYEVRRQGLLPLVYKGRQIDVAYRLDMLVDNSVVIELKAIEKIMPVHEAQLTSYLRMSGYTLGLLMNFHSPVLYKDIRRRVNSYARKTDS